MEGSCYTHQAGVEEISVLRTLSLGAVGSQISGYSSWGQVPVLCEAVVLFGRILGGGGILTGPQGVKDESPQQVLVLPVSEGAPLQLVSLSLGSERGEVSVSREWVDGQSEHRSWMVLGGSPVL